jgi:DHA2 family multidrug resistance protein
MAPVAGPLLGGWITDNISWPWIFYINVPVGIVAATATWLIYHRRETPRQQIPIDGVGLLLLVIWVGSLQLMLDKGKDQDWFQSSLIVTLAVVALLGLAVFVVWELTDEHPVVDLRLFKRRNFLTGTISVSLTYGAYFGSIVLLPLWLQEYMGYTATDAGMTLAPVGALALFMTPLVGRYSHRFDPRVLASAALLLFAVVSAMRGRFNTTADLWTIIIPTVIQGGAVSMFFIPLISLSLAGLSPRQIPAATGLNNFLRITAGAFGTSIATTLWDHFASMHHERLVAHVTVHDPAAVQALSTLKSAGLSGVQADAYLNQIINQQAYTMAASDVFYASAVLLLVLVPLLWLAGRRRAQPSPEGAGVH